MHIGYAPVHGCALSEIHQWDDLPHALAAAQTGFVSFAAKRLDTNQSTVSRRLLQLEGPIAGMLFDRTRRGAKPTELGTALLNGARRVEREVVEIHDALRQSQPVTGTMRITTTGELAAHCVIPKIDPLIEKPLPALRIHLLT